MLQTEDHDVRLDQNCGVSDKAELGHESVEADVDEVEQSVPLEVQIGKAESARPGDVAEIPRLSFDQPELAHRA